MQIYFLIILFLFAAFVVYAAFRCRSPKVIGQIGERSVYSILTHLPDEYHLYNDVLLKAKSGRTIQIDHVVVSPYGIFVIETKNYQGMIIGNGNSDQWRQNIWGKEYSLYNPEMQNISHVGVLKQIMPYKAKCNVHSIVVFMDKARLNLRNIKESVIYARELIGEIESYTTMVFSRDEVNDINNILHKSYIVNEETENVHNAEVLQAKYRREQLVAGGVCPLCGGHLILRNGYYGSFYGCSNYPECKFTRQYINTP